MAYFITRSILLFATLFADISIFDVRALRDMHIKVPEAVRVGESVTLACDYDLESVALYTIKWYRYDEEFYRYVPKESPPSRVFIMPHLNVDVSRSNSREVTLTDVERETSGEFKCEVSADAPLFHTDIRAANLLVAEVPDEGPVLRTEVQEKSIGASIKANCTTPGSYPAMNITWFINDIEMEDEMAQKENVASVCLRRGPAYPPEQNYSTSILWQWNVVSPPVDMSRLRLMRVVEHHPGVRMHRTVERYDALPGVETVRSALSINASADLFKTGKMKIRCLATLLTLYSKSQESELHDDAPQLALIMVQSTSSNEGMFFSSGTEKNSLNFLMVLFLFYVHLHAWPRKLHFQ